METIICNPGLQHLAEKVLLNLDPWKLKICRQINQYCKQILQNPLFWLKKFRNISTKYQKDWIKVLKKVKNSDKSNEIISYLQWKLKKDPLEDFLCYTNPAIQDDFRKKIHLAVQYGHTEIVKILAPLRDNPNAPDEVGITQIYWATWNGYIGTEIVKILVPLTDNPNAPNNNGETPIFKAALKGYSEIVKILVPLTDNPNASDKYGIYELIMNS